MKPWLWIDAVVMLVAAALLVAGVGAAGLWIGVIAVGVAAVVLLNRRRGTAPTATRSSTMPPASAHKGDA